MAISIDPATKDLLLADGQFTQVTGVNHAGERVRDRLYTFRNEWFLDKDYGVPYLEKILGEKRPNLTAITQILKKEIRKSLGDDARLTAFQIKFDSATREMEGSLILTDAEGEVFQDQFIM